MTSSDSPAAAANASPTGEPNEPQSATTGRFSSARAAANASARVTSAGAADPLGMTPSPAPALTSRRSNAPAGTSLPAASQSVTPAPSGYRMPRAAGRA